MVHVEVPTLGESVNEATVASWAKSVGDRVAADDILCELETDKVSIEVHAPSDGVMSELHAEAGDSVVVGQKLATISAASDREQSTGTRKKEYDGDGEVRQAESAPDVEDAPSAKKLMADHAMEPDKIRGTGRDGRIMKEDVLRTVDEGESGGADAVPSPKEIPIPAVVDASPALPPVAEVQSGDNRQIERIKMSRLRQTIARRLKEAQNTAAILTTYNEVDMSRIMRLRSDYKDMFLKKHGVKLGFMPFFVKACCSALLEIPELNAEIDGTEIVYKKFVDMGIAVGTPAGLVVPVLRNAEKLTFPEIERQLAELGGRAREGKLSLPEMQGGTFSISNGGVYGSLMSSPILNTPQSGILGMHKIQDRPVAIDGKVEIRPMMYLALSYDHRIVDGRGAVTFLVRVKELLEDPRRMLMEI